MRDVFSGRHGYKAEELRRQRQRLIRAKLAGSCLTAAVYFLVYFPVMSAGVPAYLNRHGGVRSAAVAEACNSRWSKVGWDVLGWYPHLMSEKNGKPMKIAVLAVTACISKSILPTYGRFSRARSQLCRS